MVYIKTVFKTVPMGNIDLASKKVKWAIQCFTSSLCGDQSRPVNTGI